MSPIIKFNELLSYIQKNLSKKLLFYILLDNVDSNVINKLKKYFNGTPEYNYITDNFKKIKLQQYQLNNLSVWCKFYTLSKITEKYTGKIKTCKTMYSKCLNNWKIRLILENPLCTKNYNVDWDNFSNIYIEIYFENPLTKFNEIHINELQNYIKYFITNRNGGNVGVYNDKKYIIGLLNKYIKPKREYHHLNDSFNDPMLLNRTEYFNIINNIDKNAYCINNMYSGVEYMIFIDSDKDVVYYFNKYETHTTLNKILNSGICLLSSVKYKDAYIIRRVIIDNGLYIKDDNINQINERNKKFGELLDIKTVSYSNITTTNYKKCIDAYNKKIKGEIDFIEFSHINRPFFENSIYQWSPKKMPIIFYCIECPSTYLTLYKQPEKTQLLYILYLSINIRDLKASGIKHLPFHNEIFGSISEKSFIMPVQFAPSTFPNAFLFYSNIPNLNKQYISLIFDYDLKKWIFIEKAHKSDTNIYGDNFKSTELNVWNSYRNPVLAKDLTIDKSKINEQMYFVSLKSKMHESPIKLNNFCKISLINTYVNASSTVIDLASGRASDLMTYRLAKAHDILFCEIDKDAIDTAIQRRYEFDNPNNTPLKIFNSNLNDEYKLNLEQIQNNYFNNKVTNIFCFFALHYLTDTVDRIRNIGSLISNLLDKGGEFVYTAFDGDAIINLLENNKGKWEIYENGIKKYSIISKYKKSDINKTVRPIKLILPFNSNTYYYDENLINTSILDVEFAKLGLKVDREGNFMDFAEKFKEKKIYFYNQLTEADKIFNSLYKYKVYIKS